jgi:hypothetical protein
MVQASNSNNSKPQSKKGIIFYNLAHGMTNTNKQTINEHGATLNGYKEQKRNNNEEGGAQQKRKKRKTIPPHSTTNFFLTKTLQIK